MKLDYFSNRHIQTCMLICGCNVLYNSGLTHEPKQEKLYFYINKDQGFNTSVRLHSKI